LNLAWKLGSLEHRNYTVLKKLKNAFLSFYFFFSKKYEKKVNGEGEEEYKFRGSEVLRF